MSAPRCLRLAIESCRPIKSSNLRLRPTMQMRSFVKESDGKKPDLLRDITEGFPMPEVSGPQPVEENTSKEKELLETIPSAPPKRSMPALQRPESSTSEVAMQHPSLTTPFTEPQVPSQVTAKSDSEDQSQNDKHQQQQRPVPPNVLHAYLTPQRHSAPHGIPVAQLQLRSYSVRNLEFYADFAMRAAFYLGLPASGPVPLPKKIERWTTLKSNFVNKKAQENFERITLRRLIQIKDGHRDVVEIWLAYLRKWQFYGVGMKADVWGFEGLDVAGKMDKDYAQIEKELDEKLSRFGFNRSVAGQKTVDGLMKKDGVLNRRASPMSQLREDSTTMDQRILNPERRSAPLVGLQ